ncbi:MAG: hypothetical protein WCR24_05380 [Candidatus Methanomethylophilaceae archaeon]
MQIDRDSIRTDRKGILDLPLKLMVTMIILALSVPLIVEAVDNNEMDMMDFEMEQEVVKFKNAVSAVHYSGEGSSRTVELDIPPGCEIIIGGTGADAYSVRTFFEGEQISVYYFEKPVVTIPIETIITSDCTLLLKSTYYDGRVGIEVSVL